MPPRGDVVVAHSVQDGPGRLVAQDGGVALDEGVQMLLREEVGGNALDLVRRTAVEGGDGDAAEDECYNCEWSTELYVPQAYEEYVKAWFAASSSVP